MLAENTAPEMGHLEDPREHPMTAQEPHRAQSRARSRWTEATTLVPLVTSCLALLLSAYAVFSKVHPVLPIPAALSTEAPVTHTAMPQIGSTGRIGTTTTACFGLQDYQKVRDLRASDPGAADQYASQACGTFEAGVPVTIDKVSAADSAVCAHQVEHSLCFWITGEAFATKP